MTPWYTIIVIAIALLASSFWAVMSLSPKPMAPEIGVEVVAPEYDRTPAFARPELLEFAK